MRTQLKYLNGIQFLHDKVEDSKFTTFFDEASTDEKVIVTPQTGSTVYILGLVVQNDDTDPNSLLVAVRLQSPTEDTGQQVIERFTLQPDEIAVRYYPSLRIVGNDARTFHIVADNRFNISCWFYTENTTNEADSNRES